MRHTRNRGNDRRALRVEGGLLEARRLLSGISFEAPAYHAAGPATPPGHGARLVAAGDFNGDGALDLVAAGDDVSLLPVVRHYVRVMPGRGDGTFAPPAQVVPVGTNTSDVAVGDFNGDGRLDAVVGEDQDESVVYVLFGNGDGTLGAARAFHSGSHTRDLAVADFNGDGRLDVVAADAAPWAPFGTRIASTNAGALLLGNGDGTFQREQFVDTGRRPQHFVEAGDVNGDGHVDAVFGQVVIGPGDFAAPQSLVFASVASLDVPARPAATVPAAITGLRLADLDGDGTLDVAASAMRDFLGNGAAAVTLGGAGDGRFSAPKLWDVPANVANDVAVADFNADGRPDLALASEDTRWARPTPVPAAVTLENLGRGAFGDARVFPLADDVAYPGGLATGRFDRDPLPDVAVALPGSNRMGVLVNDTPAIVPARSVLRTVRPRVEAGPLTRFVVTGVRPGADAFDVSVRWGDGTNATGGTVVENADGSFGVLGTHVYRRPGLYRVSVVIRLAEAGLVRQVTCVLRVVAG
jgi:hypothetical protein